MKTRTETLLEKAQNMRESTLQEYEGLPSPHEYNDSYGRDGKRFCYPFEYQKLRKICHQNSQMGFAQGVFHALSAVSMDEQKEKRGVSLTNGAGI